MRINAILRCLSISSNSLDRKLLVLPDDSTIDDIGIDEILHQITSEDIDMRDYQISFINSSGCSLPLNMEISKICNDGDKIFIDLKPNKQINRNRKPSKTTSEATDQKQHRPVRRKKHRPHIQRPSMEDRAQLPGGGKGYVAGHISDISSGEDEENFEPPDDFYYATESDDIDEAEVLNIDDTPEASAIEKQIESRIKRSKGPREKRRFESPENLEFLTDIIDWTVEELTPGFLKFVQSRSRISLPSEAQSVAIGSIVNIKVTGTGEYFLSKADLVEFSNYILSKLEATRMTIKYYEECLETLNSLGETGTSQSDFNLNNLLPIQRKPINTTNTTNSDTISLPKSSFPLLVIDNAHPVIASNIGRLKKKILRLIYSYFSSRDGFNICSWEERTRSKKSPYLVLQSALPSLSLSECVPSVSNLSIAEKFVSHYLGPVSNFYSKMKRTNVQLGAWTNLISTTLKWAATEINSNSSNSPMTDGIIFISSTLFSNEASRIDFDKTIQNISCQNVFNIPIHIIYYTPFVNLDTASFYRQICDDSGGVYIEMNISVRNTTLSEIPQSDSSSSPFKISLGAQLKIAKLLLNKCEFVEEELILENQSVNRVLLASLSMGPVPTWSDEVESAKRAYSAELNKMSDINANFNKIRKDGSAVSTLAGLFEPTKSSNVWKVRGSEEEDDIPKEGGKTRKISDAKTGTQMLIRRKNGAFFQESPESSSGLSRPSLFSGGGSSSGRQIIVSKEWRKQYLSPADRAKEASLEMKKRMGKKDGEFANRYDRMQDLLTKT